jgi:hypothetical protein
MVARQKVSLSRRGICGTVFALFALSPFAWPEQSMAGYYYYCPKGNGAFTGDAHFMAGRVNEAFPTRLSSFPAGRLVSPSIEWKLSDCSDERFLCIDIERQKTFPARRLFVPRRPKIGASYHDGAADALVMGSASSSDDMTVQVIVSQEIYGSRLSTKLTLQNGRGVVFIDGLNFWNQIDYRNGETCVLESMSGLFSTVDISVQPDQKIQ